jgi:xanthine dehydrogenase iron-sulfur cluster and FAD-binding subunit A
MKAFAPESLDEALLRMAETPGLRPLAGCTDLMVAGAQACRGLPGVLDLQGIPELRGIEWREEVLEIGAVTTF